MSREFSPKDEENQINIKMPDNVSLAELSEYISELDCIFNKMQAMRKINENNDFTLKRVDSGSVWLIIAVSVAAAVATIGKIVTLSIYVKKQRIENDIMLQKLRALKSGADVIENIARELSEKLKEDCTQKARNISDEDGLSLNHEEVSSLVIGTEKLANLLFKGVEIYASLEASKITTDAFPKQEASPLLKAAKLLLPPVGDSE